MSKWTDYTIKTNPADNDEVMILDTAGKANKRLGLSVLSDWILNKLADKTFQKLATSDKTIIGSINALNSSSFKNVDIANGKNYDLDNYKSGLYCFTGTDTGNNTGTALPDATVSVVSQIGNIQIAAAINQSYYIRYYWGKWREWKKIS